MESKPMLFALEPAHGKVSECPSPDPIPGERQNGFLWKFLGVSCVRRDSREVWVAWDMNPEEVMAWGGLPPNSHTEYAHFSVTNYNSIKLTKMDAQLKYFHLRNTTNQSQIF